MSYVVINELFVDPESAQLFEKNFAASMMGTLGSVHGLASARLLAPERPDRGYLSILEFADRSDYERYLGSEEFRAAHNWPDHAPFQRSELAEFVQIADL